MEMFVSVACFHEVTFGCILKVMVKCFDRNCILIGWSQARSVLLFFLYCE